MKSSAYEQILCLSKQTAAGRIGTQVYPRTITIFNQFKIVIVNKLILSYAYDCWSNSDQVLMLKISWKKCCYIFKLSWPGDREEVFRVKCPVTKRLHSFDDERSSKEVVNIIIYNLCWPDRESNPGNLTVLAVDSIHSTSYKLRKTAVYLFKILYFDPMSNQTRVYRFNIYSHNLLLDLYCNFRLLIFFFFSHDEGHCQYASSVPSFGSN